MSTGVAPSPRPPGVAGTLRRTGPRVARDGFGPLLAFFVTWKLVGLAAGIAAAVLVAGLLYRYERRRERPGMVVRLALGLVLIRATVGLVTGSAATYLGQEIAIDLLLGSAFVASVIAGRPLTELFADEIFPMPDSLRGRPVYRSAMRRIALVWGAYFLLRAGVRALAFVTLTKDAYVLVVALSDVPFLIGLLGWSVWYTTRTVRRDPAFAVLLEPA